MNRIIRRENNSLSARNGKREWWPYASSGRVHGGPTARWSDRHLRHGRAPIAWVGCAHHVGLHVIHHARRQAGERVARNRRIQLTRLHAERDREVGRRGQHADGIALRFLDEKTAAQQHRQVALASDLHITRQLAHQRHETGALVVFRGRQRHAAACGINVLQRRGERVQGRCHRRQRGRRRGVTGVAGQSFALKQIRFRLRQTSARQAQFTSSGFDVRHLTPTLTLVGFYTVLQKKVWS